MLLQFSDTLLYCNEDASDWNSIPDKPDTDTDNMAVSNCVSATPSLASCSAFLTPPGFQNSDEELKNVARLLESEGDHVPDASYVNRYHDRSVIVSGREMSVNWVMKVHGYYKFKPVTALLAVNYFDRFLSVHQLPKEEKGWSFQLLSIACLTLAAKLEELDVPPLLDFQLFEPKFVFESKTVQKMELMVMENLKWRLYSITPLHFVEPFTANLCSSCSSYPDTQETFRERVVRISSSLILSTVYVMNFVGLLPSVIAAAAVILAAGENVQIPESFYQGLNKDMVTRCHQAMRKYLSDSSSLSHSKGQISISTTPPFSPAGILDVVNMRSLSNQSSEMHGPEPAFKRLKTFHSRLEEH